MSEVLNITYQIEDVDKVAKQILQHLTSKTLLFYGEIGVGKTTLIKALAKQLGSTDDVSSPTFSIVNEYSADDAIIYHFDLYRIEDEEDALNFGFEDYLYTSNWVFIEWPEQAKNLLPNDVNVIEISHKNETSRSLKLSHNTILTQKNPMEQHNF
ncbi:tRNA (adenosine(37)-N6)-threonylcarbamoyltransferase complex ATPase subunit type 1 TsaE [Psychroserpens sp. MEBiC05023]